MHTTPSSLFERLRNPAGDGWEELVRLYTPLLYAWAGRAGLQEADAADLVQDVLVVLVSRIREFEYDPNRSFRAWLRTVTLNKLRERWRRAGPSANIGDLAEDVAGPEELEAFWESEYQQYLVGQALRLMQAEFQPTTWKACWEHLAKGRPAAEVGAELGLSAGAVRAATFRVLTRLRQRLARLLD